MAHSGFTTLNGYKRSSYLSYIGKAKTPDWLDTHDYSTSGWRSRLHQARLYRQAFEAALSQATLDEPWTEVISSLGLGSRDFVQIVKQEAKRTEAVRERLRRRPSGSEIISAV